MNFGDELRQVSEEACRRFLGDGDAKSPGIREWFVAGASYFVVASSNTRLTVEAIDETWRDANGADSRRFFWAARDSIMPSASPACNRQAIGWSAVHIYYSGFYLMLAFLRAFGSGLVYLNKEDCDAICASPNLIRLQSGIYELSFAVGQRATISLAKKSYSGFHEGFWRFADDRLSGIANDAALGSGMYSAFSGQFLQQAVIGLEDLRSWLGRAGAAGRDIGWMSALRNELNYRLARRAWSPNVRSDGVEVTRLRQDVIAILRGRTNRIGVQLQIDNDIRAMIERNSVLYRNLSPLSGVPEISRC